MSKKQIISWLLFSLILAFFISPLASSFPDGLERVAEDKGFLEKGEEKSVFTSPIPDYAWPGIDNEGLATSLAGIFGTFLVFGLGYGIGSIIKGK